MNEPSVLEALIAADPYCDYLGIHPVAEPHHDQFEPPVCWPDLVLHADEHHIGNHRTLGMHGGVICAFLESAARLHVRSAIGLPVRTVTFTAEFLREARIGQVRARTEIVRKGRRLAVARVIAWQEDASRPVATGHGAFVVSGGITDPG